MAAPYATYKFYSDTFLGTAIAEADFLQLALRASVVIDQITFGRAAIQTDETILEALSMACCAVAEELQIQAANGNMDGITSERVGNLSITFGDNARAILSNGEKLARAARIYLESTGLMFRGFEVDEYSGGV